MKKITLGSFLGVCKVYFKTTLFKNLSIILSLCCLPEIEDTPTSAFKLPSKNQLSNKWKHVHKAFPFHIKGILMYKVILKVPGNARYLSSLSFYEWFESLSYWDSEFFILKLKRKDELAPRHKYKVDSHWNLEILIWALLPVISFWNHTANFSPPLDTMWNLKPQLIVQKQTLEFLTLACPCRHVGTLYLLSRSLSSTKHAAPTAYTTGLMGT